MQFKPLSRRFYEPSAQEVAPALLGHWLIRVLPEGLCGGPIVEAEAYLQNDPACHAAVGLTPRNQVMFGPPGRAYVYFIYGAHFCVNAVCQPAGTAEAVLIRAVEPVIGVDLLRAKRACPTLRALTNGPAKLCQAMGIDRALDGTDLCDERSPLMIARGPLHRRFLDQKGPMVTDVRVGISQAAHLPLRFFLKSSEFVSRTPGRGGFA